MFTSTRKINHIVINTLSSSERVFQAGFWLQNYSTKSPREFIHEGFFYTIWAVTVVDGAGDFWFYQGARKAHTEVWNWRSTLRKPKRFSASSHSACWLIDKPYSFPFLQFNWENVMRPTEGRLSDLTSIFPDGKVGSAMWSMIQSSAWTLSQSPWWLLSVIDFYQ